MPHSGWPFGHEAISSCLDLASQYLGAGPHLSNGPRSPPLPRSALKPEVDPGQLRNIWWTQGKGPDGGTIKFARLFRKRLHPAIRVLVHATVVHLNTNAAGSDIDSVEISDPEGRRAIVKSRVVVLCAGGIENARILLYSNRVIPVGVGNFHDLVGRFLMDHPRDLTMAITMDPKEQHKIRKLFGPYVFDNGDGPREFLGGLQLSPEIQRREQLLNCVAWPIEEISEDDPTWAAVRLAKGDRTNLFPDLMLVASDIGLVLGAARSRLLTHQPVRRKCRKLGFLIASEQCPNPNSRVTLSKRLDRFGLPIARTDWRISSQDWQSQVVLAKTIEKEFQRLRLPKVHLADWITSGRLHAGVLSDGCHPTGTTRMASDPRCGVVDPDCRVHGIDGLYIAGSSVFPTAGHANPTLMIIAMAARLAEHLKTRLASSQLRAEPSPPADATAVPPDPKTVQSLQSAFAEGGVTMENKVAANDARTYVVEPGTIVAVTGSTGFIGGRLAERLVEQGAAVTCLLRGDPSPRLQRLGAKLCKIDIANEDAVRNSLKGIDWVFHCAYNSNSTEWNFKALLALIAACRQNEWRRFVHVSSFVVYDLPAEGELTEETVATTDRPVMRT